MEGRDGDNTHSTQPQPIFTVADFDLSPIKTTAILASSDYSPDDHVPRPPAEPLTTGQQVAGVIDGGGAILGSLWAMSKFRENGLDVLRSDVRSLDKLANTPELHEFRSLGSTLNRRVATMVDGAQGDVLAMQTAKPYLFESITSRGMFKGFELKQPKYDLMNTAERAVVDRADNLGYISDSLQRGAVTSSTRSFKSGLVNLRNLENNPWAVREGLAPGIKRIQNLGSRVEEQVADSTISLAAESRAVLLKNTGVLGLGLATNFVIEKTLLKDSAPNLLTIGTDCVTPFIVLSELPLWAKFGVMVGGHAAARLAEYGMSK